MSSSGRKPLSNVNENTSRALQLNQWKEAREVSKKRDRVPDGISAVEVQLRKKTKSQQKDISDLQCLVNKHETELAEALAKSEKLQQECTDMSVRYDIQLEKYNRIKSALIAAVNEHENDRDHIRALEEKCSHIDSLKSHIVEISLMYNCMVATSAMQTPLPKPNPVVERSVITNARVHDAEKAALQAEIKVLKTKNATLQVRCDELLFSQQLLLQQNAEVIQNGVEYISEREAQHIADRDADKEVVATAMESLESDLTKSLDKSLKKIEELQEEIAALKNSH
uniref:Uncharacterized protein n=1 Tax=Spongospora subterranea TaxID=70186 RepID=A0A0H5R6K1_9EUKA|eukprot:CRZ09748.1 hypothetical protein [Spongospora subterranea]